MNKIIINISFNDLNDTQGSNLRKEWVDKRIDILMNYTIKSLKKQTNQNFMTFIKYEDHTEEFIVSALTNYETLPKNIQFIKKSEVKSIISTFINKTSFDNLLIIFLESDDMYHKNYIEKLASYSPKPNTLYLINKKGYVYDSLQQRLAYWEEINPQYIVFIFKSNDINGLRRCLLNSTPKVLEFPHEIIEGFNYMRVVHLYNPKKRFSGTPFVREQIEDTDKIKQIINEFI